MTDSMTTITGTSVPAQGTGRADDLTPERETPKLSHGMITNPSPRTLHELTIAEPGKPVLSVHLRTDPRDPDNTTAQPAWLVELRNGLAAVSTHLEEGDDRDSMLAFRDFAPALVERVMEMPAEERGRSLSLFTTLDRSFEVMISTQIPVRESLVRWDTKPFIGPLMEVVDRGRPMLVAVIDNDESHLYRFSDGRLSTLEELGGDLAQWWDNLPGGEGRGPRFRSHEQQVEARAEEHRARFLTEVASDLTNAFPRLDVDGLVLMAAPGCGPDVIDALAQPVRDRMVAHVEAHVTGLDAADLSDRVGEIIEEAWRSRNLEYVEQSRALASSGGAGVTGVSSVLDALAEHRLERLVMSPELVIEESDISPMSEAFMSDIEADMRVERMLEKAAETRVQVSVVPDSESLAALGGAAGLLRW